MTDPTAEQMRAFLRAEFAAMEDSHEDPKCYEFAREEAIYWYAAHYHGGQSSNLYSALSVSEFRPGPLANGLEDSEMYDALVREYGGV